MDGVDIGATGGFIIHGGSGDIVGLDSVTTRLLPEQMAL
jgi:hypothetical protein